MKRGPRLRSLKLANFKAVDHSGTVAFNPLTVLIGNNGSGKSSLMCFQGWSNGKGKRV